MTSVAPEAHAISRMFADCLRSGDAVWFSLPGGRPLYEAGEPAETLFYLRAGRLGAVRREEGQEPVMLGVIRPGEPAGEMALIAGTPHTAGVFALRDSEILAMPREAFLSACDADPAIMGELARLMMRRVRQASSDRPLGAPAAFGFAGVTAATRVRPLVEKVARALVRAGWSCVAAGAEAAAAPTEWFSNIETAHDFVLYAAEWEEHGWRQIVERQVDRLFRVAAADAAPPLPVSSGRLHPPDPRPADLILVHPATAARPSGSAAWAHRYKAVRTLHVREGSDLDSARLGRILSGQSVGLVLSGGGARAYAHIGAVQALREAGAPIDFVGGASMGAVIAAAVAMGWDDAEIERRVRKAFVESSPVDDISFPLISLARGEKVEARLHEHFGETEIHDLWLPFFCVSSNLTTGAYHLHGDGAVRHALRASIAIPGLLPPVADGENVLVDGAVMKNFPADIMRSVHDGPIVGVDVTRGRILRAADVRSPGSWSSWLLSGAWRKGPPIVSLLMRAATVSSARDIAANREASDLLILPMLDGVEIRDWDAYGPAVASGLEATRAALSALTRPIIELRRSARQARADAGRG